MERPTCFQGQIEIVYLRNDHRTPSLTTFHIYIRKLFSDLSWNPDATFTNCLPGLDFFSGLLFTLSNGKQVLNTVLMTRRNPKSTLTNDVQPSPLNENAPGQMFTAVFALSLVMARAEWTAAELNRIATRSWAVARILFCAIIGIVFFRRFWIIVLKSHNYYYNWKFYK